jgi:hypothetical protein
MTARVEAAIAAALHGGDKDGARQQFAELWSEIGDAGDPLCRCRLAHHMADLQDDPAEELAWDLRALEAAALLTDADVQNAHASLSVAAFYPSLLLNVAEAYRKLGDLPQAREYLARARGAMDVLPDTGYGAMIRGGIARLAQRLESRASDVSAP